MVLSGSEQWGVGATSAREHPVFRDPFYSPGHEVAAHMAVCTPASASTEEDERTGDRGDVGSDAEILGALLAECRGKMSCE